MTKLKISNEQREQIKIRASNSCEYCLSQDKYAPHSFTVDHILAQSLGGTNNLGNLAYCCFLCNRLKTNKKLLLDPNSLEWFPIYNPRIHKWSEHFMWNEETVLIIGKTSIGILTINVLKLNREKLIEYRESIIPFGTHPPKIYD